MCAYHFLMGPRRNQQMGSPPTHILSNLISVENLLRITALLHTSQVQSRSTIYLHTLEIKQPNLIFNQSSLFAMKTNALLLHILLNSLVPFAFSNHTPLRTTYHLLLICTSQLHLCTSSLHCLFSTQACLSTALVWFRIAGSTQQTCPVGPWFSKCTGMPTCETGAHLAVTFEAIEAVMGSLSLQDC